MYRIHCPICDIETTVQVHYDEDIPRHCPMCASDVEVEFEEVDDDDGFED